MIGRESIVGTSVLCALAVCAFAASNAWAGGRAYTCVSGGGALDYATADTHCVTNVGVGNGTRGHVAIAETAAIEVTNANTASGTTASTASNLEGTISGFETAVKCKALSGTGSLTNEATFAEGTGVIHYAECNVAKPAGIGCKIKENQVTTEGLKATTSGLAANRLKFEPAGVYFAKLNVEGCSVAALNKTFPVFGSLIANTNGATTTTTHSEITNQGTLIFGGNAAGLEGALTISREGGSPITLT